MIDGEPSDAKSIGDHARSVASSLGGVLDPPERRGAASLTVLLQWIDDKCRPLLGTIDYSSRLALEPGASELSMGPERSLPIVRIAQELVRNAVVHGRARLIAVELTLSGRDLSLQVEDDGSGLTRERFENATGGLANAADWLDEIGGALALVAPSDGTRSTALRATVAIS